MKSFFHLLVLSTLLAGCGGGGSDGGDGQFQAANVGVSVSPSSIDTGDRTEVRVSVSEVTTDGIILKIRFPAELSYVLGSSFLKVDNREEGDRDITPAYYVPGEAGGATFLVFTFTLTDFGANNSGEVVFQLRGDEATEDESSLAAVEVDADFLGTDPLTEELAISEFSSEDEADITVEPEAL